MMKKMSKLVANILVFIMIFNNVSVIADEYEYLYDEKYEEYEEHEVYPEYEEHEEHEVYSEYENYEENERIMLDVITRDTSSASSDQEFLEMVISNILYTSSYDTLSLVVPNSIRLHRGSIEQIGIFQAPPSMGFPIENGIVLTPGRAESAFSISNFFHYNILGGEGYEPLSLLSVQSGGSANTHSAVVLEFQIIPQSDYLHFDYLFASEEFRFSQNFNDIFALWVVDNYDEEVLHNIALLPYPTSLPVTINNTRPVPGTSIRDIPGPYFVPTPYRSIGDYFFPYLGHTILLTADATGMTGSNGELLVQRNYPVTLRLAIANAGDDLFASAVFIKGNSLIVHDLEDLTLPEIPEVPEVQLPPSYVSPPTQATYVTAATQSVIEAPRPSLPYMFTANVLGANLNRESFHSSHNIKNTRVTVHTPALIIKLRTYVSRGDLTEQEFLEIRNQIFNGVLYSE